MTRKEVPPLASDLDEGADKEANSLAGGAWGGWRSCGGREFLIFTRRTEDGNRSLFLGEAFIQCDDIPLMMAGHKNQSRK